MNYAWKQGSRIGEVDAQLAGESLEAIRETHGSITAAIVVEEARPKTAPLHPVFEWNNRAAAEQYRLVQARELVRAIVIRPVEHAEGQPVRAFVTIQETDGAQVYTSTHVALEDATLRKQVLDRALRELSAWEQRYQDLQELAEVFASVRIVRQTLDDRAAA